MSKNLIKDIPREQIKSLFDIAFAHSYRWWVDKLDCSISWRRQPINMLYSDFWEMVKDNPEATVFYTCMQRIDYSNDSYYFDFCVDISINNVAYFLWVLVSTQGYLNVMKEFKNECRT